MGAHKDVTVVTKYLGLYCSLCGFVANRSRRLIGTAPAPLA